MKTPPRGYQSEAIDAIVAHLAGGGRGQVHAACGTGKTLLAAHAAVRVCPPGGLVVVACPSLALVAQTIRVWGEEQAATAFLAVGSDSTVADSLIRVADLPCPTTTDPATVADWLRQPVNQGGRRLIVTTHVSAGEAGAGLIAVGVTADLLIVDEAHHTAGHAQKRSRLLHDDVRLPATRRLYLTATPRYLAAGIARNVHAETVSMDDSDTFGPLLYEYPTATAIRDGWLDDYRVAVIGVTRRDVLQVLRRMDADAVVDGGPAPLRTAVVQTALAQAAAEFGLRRVIVFTNRVATAHEFARTMPGTLAALDGDMPQPAGPLVANAVDGRMTVEQRHLVMQHLVEPPPGGWAVVANARCLSEGVDVPAVDGVVFTHPKRSTVDVIQAVGRALRRNPDGSGIATILVPVLLDDDGTNVADIDIDNYSEYATLWQVIRALRAHDSTLVAELDAQLTKAGSPPAELPHRIVVQLPDGYDAKHYLRHLTVRLLQQTTSPWQRAIAACRRYHAKHGALHPPVAYVDDDGYPLGQFLAHRRYYRRKGWLSEDQIADLDAFGMIWDPVEAAWWERLEDARRYHATYGHLHVPHTGQTRGLAQWLAAQRKKRANLSTQQRHALDDLGMVWDPVPAFDQRWNDGIAACHRFRDEHNHLRVPKDYVDDEGFPIGAWLGSRRNERRAGTLDPQRVQTLTDLGIIWDPAEQRWLDGVAAARRYHAAFGHLRVPDNYVDPDGYRLGKFIAYQRLLYKGTRTSVRFTPEHIADMEQLGMVWSVRSRRQPGRPPQET